MILIERLFRLISSLGIKGWIIRKREKRNHCLGYINPHRYMGVIFSIKSLRERLFQRFVSRVSMWEKRTRKKDGCCDHTTNSRSSMVYWYCHSHIWHNDFWKLGSLSTRKTESRVILVVWSRTDGWCPAA